MQAILSLQFLGKTLDHHGKNDGGPNHWIKVKITPQIHLFLLKKSGRFSVDDG